ncbi:hypothetical protein GCM10011415_26520 [Salipiger pallidus]|uniref:Uncharacterized protein n=1 Tax=Salipiger pallidus TaxID=1775170 RepID=A0A8J2ZKR0_9RHOB|nr:hypothetical protein GCM10011415_26520 [Salipiger pallidus]
MKGTVQTAKVVDAYREKCVGNPAEFPGWTEMLLDLRNKRVGLLVGNSITPADLIESTDRPLKMPIESLSASGNALVVQPEAEALTSEIDSLLPS